MIISQQFKDLYKTFINEMLRANSLSVSCKLIYEGSVFNECVNCIVDPISHKSANLYKSGGPLIFADGQICPYCRGLGGIYQESFDVSNFLVIFDYKYWINFNSKIHSPEGLVQTISKFEDYQKIKSCNKIIIDTSIQNYTESYFQRNSEPEPCGLGDNAYIFTLWKKI
jgi:hypothetical protein